MNYCKVKAGAKINLTLDITGVSGGYHLLDSLVVSLDLSDLIAAKRRKDGAIKVYSHGEGTELLPETENNAYKAAKLFAEEFQTDGAELKIYKNIPMGAGLGGSSADAAGALHAMRQLYLKEITPETEERILQIADRTGSDTRAMYLGGAVRMRGRGDIVESLPIPQNGAKKKKSLFSFFSKPEKKMMYFLLICPLTPVSTPQCFQKFDEMGVTYPLRTQEAVERFIKGDVYGLGKLMKNDLQEAACKLNPDVKIALEEAKKLLPTGVCMSGSGSTVVAMFDTEEKCRWAYQRYTPSNKNVWVIDAESVF